MDANRIDLSFVIPLYNEEAVFDRLAARLQTTMDLAKQRCGLNCETVLVDDGSDDRTGDAIDSLCKSDPRFRGVLLSRNFGHQRALSAGLDHTRGETVGVLDGDLQDPPELLLQFHEKLTQGFDVVYAVRKNRKENIVKRTCYWAFYRLLRKLAAVDIPLDAGDFCLMRRAVVDQIRKMPERHRFIRGMRSWVGYRQAAFPYDRAEREAGESKYSMSKLILLAVDGLLTFSEIPLRVATFSGAAVALLSMLWAGYICLWRLLDGPSELAGFATITCGMFFLGGIQLICLGILGEYIARIHNEVKKRPIYIVDRVIEGVGSANVPPIESEQTLRTVLDSIAGLRAEIDGLQGAAPNVPKGKATHV